MFTKGNSFYTSNERGGFFSTSLIPSKLSGVYAMLFLTMHVLSAAASDKLLIENSDMIRGQLDNGLSYLLFPIDKKNDLVSIRLLVRVGSLNEGAGEEGIAHFVEHMAFESGKRFSKSDKLNFRDQTGLTFGSHVNASTGFSYTSYILDVPVSNNKYRETALALMRDTAGGLLFKQAEIDRIKNVLVEEHHLRETNEVPIGQQWHEYQDENGVFSKHYPIGNLSVIKKMDSIALVDFYKRWYQPQSMTIIVSGNIDRSLVEESIWQQFSDLKNTGESLSAQADSVMLKTNPFSASNKNAISSSSRFVSQLSIPSLTTEASLNRQLERRFVTGLINGRLRRANDALDKRFIYVGSSLVLDPRMDAVHYAVQHDDREYTRAFKFLNMEIARLKKYGISAGELNYFKKLFGDRTNKIYPKREVANSAGLANALLKYEIDNSILVSSSDLKTLRIEFLEKLTLVGANQLLKQFLNKPTSLFASYPPSERKPDFEAISKRLKKQLKRKIKPLSKSILAQPNSPSVSIVSSGKIISEKQWPKSKVVEWTLGNGIKILLQPNKNSKNKLNMVAFRKGGLSQLPDELLAASGMTQFLLMQTGIEGMTAQQMRDYANSHQIVVRPFIGPYNNGFLMSLGNDKLYESLEFMHVLFRQESLEKGLVNQFKSNWIDQITKAHTLPKVQVQIDTQKTLFPESLYKYIQHPDSYRDITDAQISDVYRELYGNSSEFSVAFSGDFDPELIREPILKYIATLPSFAKRDAFSDRPKEVIVSQPKTIANYQSSEESSQLMLYFIRPSHVKSIKASYISLLTNTIIQQRLLLQARERSSLVYSIQSVFNDVSSVKRYEMFQVVSACAPGKEGELTDLIIKVFSDLAIKPVSKKELKKAVKALTLALNGGYKNNQSSAIALASSASEGISIDELLDYKEILQKITPSDIVSNMADFLNSATLVKSIYGPGGKQG